MCDQDQFEEDLKKYSRRDVGTLAGALSVAMALPRVANAQAVNESDVEILNALYWSTVTRPPTEKESARMLAFLGSQTGEEKLHALQDLAWALLNSKEFMFRH